MHDISALLIIFVEIKRKCVYQQYICFIKLMLIIVVATMLLYTSVE